MKYFIIILFLITPYIVWAWDSKSTKEQILKEFSSYTQPEAIETFLKQWNISVEYTPNSEKLTDTITIKIWKMKRVIGWPWSKKSNTDRKKAIKLREQWDGISSAGFWDYRILRISPSGNYIEFIAGGYENWSWIMVDSKSGKVILEGKVVKSMWSNDRKQFIFQTCSPSEISLPSFCTENLKTFITKIWAFPEFKQIQ